MNILNPCGDVACKQCNVWEFSHNQIQLFPRLVENSPVLFILDYPGKEEVDKQVYFAGPAGEMFYQSLLIYNINPATVSIAHLLRHRPNDEYRKKIKVKDISTCSTFLDTEIKKLKPSLIVTMGAAATKWALPTVVNFMKIRGNFFIHPEYKCHVLPMISPAHVIEDPILLSDFRKELGLVHGYLHGNTNAPVKAEKKYYHVRNIAQLDWLVNFLHKEPIWASDTETTSLDPLVAEIFLFIFSWKEHFAVTVDVRDFDTPENFSYLLLKMKEVYENSSRKIFQNGGYDFQCLYKYGIYVNNYTNDTMLMHYLLDENKDHGLEILAAEYTEMGGYDGPLTKYRKENKIDNYKDLPRDMIEEYGAADGEVTWRSYVAMLPELQKQELVWLHDNIMIPTQKVLCMTEFKGVSIDLPYLKRVQVVYDMKMAEAFKSIREVPAVREYELQKKDELVLELRKNWAESKTLTKKFNNFIDYLDFRKSKKENIVDFEFNVNSTQQLQELLIDKMGMKVLKTSDKGNISVDKEVLEAYAENNDFVIDLLAYRTLAHLKSTFIDGIEEKLSEVDGKIHTDYLLHSTDTGRPSSRAPNLNNIPRTGTAEDIKDIFCSDKVEGANNGWGDWLVETDLGQAEFRFWIFYSQDPQALYDLRMGIDIHKLMAAIGKGEKVHRGNLTLDEYKEIIKNVTKQERQDAKFVVFGIMYGRGAKSVAKQLGITIDQAQFIIDEFFARYPLAKQYLDNTVQHAITHGYTKNFFNRRRRLPNIYSNDVSLKSSAERQAFNAPIQSGASDLVFHTMSRIFKILSGMGFKTRLILTVYDSLIFNIPDKELEQVLKIVDYEMTHPPFNEKEFPYQEINVPITAEIKAGTHWGSLLEIDINKRAWANIYADLIEHESKVSLRWKKKDGLYRVAIHAESSCAWVDPEESPIYTDGLVELPYRNKPYDEAKFLIEEIKKQDPNISIRF